MKSILQELHKGAIYPEESIVPKDPRYRMINSEIDEIKKLFKKKIPDSEYKQIEELTDLYYQASSMLSRESFTYGFKLGAMIMVEVYTSKEELVRSRDKDV